VKHALMLFLCFCSYKTWAWIVPFW